MSAARPLRLVYVATGLGVLALVGGFVLASSTVGVGPSQASNATSNSPTPFSGASVVATSLVLVTPVIVGYGGLGTQSGSTGGLSGTTSTLASCAVGPCVANYNPAAQSFPAASLNFAEQVEIAVTQPTTGVGASGFDVQVSISFGLSGVAFAAGYVSTGTTSAGSSQTVDVFLFVDLGSGVAPTVNSVSVTFNSCGSSSTCP
jgi:hypothetical protein